MQDQGLSDQVLSTDIDCQATLTEGKQTLFVISQLPEYAKYIFLSRIF